MPPWQTGLGLVGGGSAWVTPHCILPSSAKHVKGRDGAGGVKHGAGVTWVWSCRTVDRRILFTGDVLDTHNAYTGHAGPGPFTL